MIWNFSSSVPLDIPQVNTANKSDTELNTRSRISYLPATIVSGATMYAATTYYFVHYANILLTRISRLQLDICAHSRAYVSFSMSAFLSNQREGQGSFRDAYWSKQASNWLHLWTNLVLAWAPFPQRNKATKWQFEWLNAENKHTSQQFRAVLYKRQREITTLGILSQPRSQELSIGSSPEAKGEALGTKLKLGQGRDVDTARTSSEKVISLPSLFIYSESLCLQNALWLSWN